VYAAGSDFLMALSGQTRCGRDDLRPGGHFGGDKPLFPGPGDERRPALLPHVVPGLWNVAGILSRTRIHLRMVSPDHGQERRGYEGILAMIRSSEERWARERESLPRFFSVGAPRNALGVLAGNVHRLGRRTRPGGDRAGSVESIAFSVREAVAMLERPAVRSGNSG